MRWWIQIALLGLLGCEIAEPPTLTPPLRQRDLGRDAGTSSGDAQMQAQPMADAAGAHLDSGPGAAQDAETTDISPATQDAGATDSGPADSGLYLPADAGVISVDASQLNPTGSQIRSIRDSEDGLIEIDVEGAVVTYVQPRIGNDPMAFYVQSERQGPAIVIEVDPLTVSPLPSAGDLVSFRALEVTTRQGRRAVTVLEAWVIDGSNQDLGALVQELTGEMDLHSALPEYESELASADLVVAGAFAQAGSAHVSARVETGVIFSNPDVVLRMPEALAQDQALGFGCSLRVSRTPIRRFYDVVQFAAWTEEDLAVSSCPAPRVVGATSEDAEQVIIHLDRPVDPASIDPTGNQFVFSGGLAAVRAAAEATALTVITTPQSNDARYSVTVAESVMDPRGVPLSAAHRTASFTGLARSAVLRINEFNANLADSCDLIELRVVEGGNLDGWVLKHRVTEILEFGPVTVASNSFIVVHLNGDHPACNATEAVDEIASPREQSRQEHPQNFDTAYDFYAPRAGGMQRTDTVITLYDNLGAMADAVLASDDPTGTTAADSERAAARVSDAGQWQTVAGTVPAGGYVDDEFCAHAVTSLDMSAANPEGVSIQRTDDHDTDSKEGWTDQVPATWGLVNPGQADF